MTTKEQATALITGASTGIGAAITDRLAARGTNLVLVARDATRLDTAAARLRAEHGVEVRTVPLDLTRPGAPAQLATQLAEAGVEVDLLVNNAGAAVVGTVGETDRGRLRGMIDLNAAAVAETTALFLPGMLDRRHGAIVNIASLAGYVPAPHNAVYAASKAFVLSFTRSLWAETRGTGVRVVAVSPGATATPMNPRRGAMTRTPQQVADTVLAALRGHGPEVVDGWVNAALTVLFTRLVPTAAVARLTGAFFTRAARAQASNGSTPLPANSSR